MLRSTSILESLQNSRNLILRKPRRWKNHWHDRKPRLGRLGTPPSRETSNNSLKTQAQPPIE
jgi:hypothetical protein